MDMEIQQVPWWNRRTRMERRFLMLSVTLLILSLALTVTVVSLLYMDEGAEASSIAAPGPRTHEPQRLPDDRLATLMHHNDKRVSVSVGHADGHTATLQTTAAFTGSHRLGSIGQQDLSSGDSKFCLTPGCIHTASLLLKNMDQKADPCTDFYQFACGGFNEKTVIPNDRTRMTTFSVLGDELLTQVRMLLEGEPTDPDEARPFKMARDVYKSCMDKEQIESLGLDPIKNILKSFGGWPVLEGPDWNDENYLWYEQIFKFRKTGYSVDYFFEFSVTTDLKNSSWRILDIDQPSLGMSREYLVKGMEDEDVKAYLEYMVDVAKLLGADPEFAQTEMLATLQFEMQLANISLPREERRNATKLYNPMTIDEMSLLAPNVPWLKYINTILSPEIIQVTGKEIIIVNVPSYHTKFSEYIKNVPARIQANYLLWRVTAASMKYLTEEARKISLRFSEKLTGKTEETDRWRTCVGAAKGSLSNAVGAMYVSKYFNQEAKEAALEMVSDIRAEFDAILDEIDWMDEGTKERAKKKARHIVQHIGYPSELMDTAKLEKLYHGLELNSTHYLRNALNMTLFGIDYAFSKLREKVNKTDWVRHGQPAVVNAFYSPLENSIQFPAGILQGIFFSNHRPRYMNYGAIGWVIGHEITHGFDDQGRQFDDDGNLVDWWHPVTKEKYVKKAQCIIDQYGNYTIPEVDNLNLNGINTQGENIADNGGIKEAYRAYNRWVARNEEEKLLPGLNYTQRQLFWVSAANVWCAKYRPKALKIRVLTGVHSPDMFRVRGPFSNMHEFSQDFHCQLGSVMNPWQKCQVW